MIPRSKMPQNGCEYRSNENVYIFRDEATNEELKVDKDSKVRCRCFEIKTELSTPAASRLPDEDHRAHRRQPHLLHAGRLIAPHLHPSINYS
jgi:DNA-directed RNA polymerase subunit E'/Rpb7